MRSIHKLYLLESNGARVHDEFSPIPIGSRGNKATKTLLRTTKNNGVATVPDDMEAVALVFEHHYYPTADSEPPEHVDVYAAPIMGYELMQQLEGRMLDYIDATYADREQRDAQKKIVRRTIHEFRDQVSKYNRQKFGWAEEPKTDGSEN